MSTTHQLGVVGLYLQTAVVVLIAALLLALRRYGRRRRYFVLWTIAWSGLALSLLVASARFALLPSVHNLAARGLDAAYVAGKVASLGLFLSGTLHFVRGKALRGGGTMLALLSAATFAAVVLTAPGPGRLGLLQVPWLVMASGASAILLARLPAERRSVGTRLTAIAFAVQAAVGLCYLLAYLELAGVRLLGAEEVPLRAIAPSAAFVDLFAWTFVAFGLLLVLTEDLRHELDRAYERLELAYDDLRKASLTDALTGSLNRRAFEEPKILDAIRHSFGVAVMIDLDNLKDVNDAFGHPAGDELLRRVSHLLRSHCRPNDWIFRWGGDEFLLLLRRARSDDVVPRLAALFDAPEPVHWGSAREELPVRVSYGCAEYASGAALEGAIRRADRAMYEEKTRRKRVREPSGSRTRDPLARD